MQFRIEYIKERKAYRFRMVDDKTRQRPACGPYDTASDTVASLIEKLQSGGRIGDNFTITITPS